MCRAIFPLAAVVFLAACAQNGATELTAETATKPCPAPVGVDANTAEMAKLLVAAMGRLPDPRNSNYENSKRADALGKDAAANPDPMMHARMELMLCEELLRAGRTTEALSIAERYVGMLDNGVMNMPPDGRIDLLHMLALGYMRMGEQANCIKNHNNESCLMPLTAKAQHTDPTGSRKAIEIHKRILREKPDDLLARWTLNVAYMTLGEHPNGVPREYFLPINTLGKTIDFPRFPDIAGELALDIDDLCGGVCLEDFNGDGILDIMASSWALTSQLRYFTGELDGTYTDRTAEAGITGITGALNMNHVDYDNDGDIDVFMLRGAWHMPGDQPNSLLRNNGNGTFSDVTREAGLLSYHPTQSGNWSDYDRDGDLDIFIGNESDKSNPHKSELYRNNGDGTFTDVAAEAGVDVSYFVKGAAWGDVDHNGYPDLYVSCLGEPNPLFMNPGPDANGVVRFTNNAGKAGVDEPIHSFPTWMWDFDNDGWLDIWVSSFPREAGVKSFAHYNAAHLLGMPPEFGTSRLYRNKHDGTFEDVTQKAGLARPLFAMGSNFGDLNNDGWLDMYLGTGEPDLRALIPNFMLLNDGKGRFVDVTAASGTGSLQKGHGVALADMDNDGDQDIYAVMGGAYQGDNYHNLFFQNPGNWGNHWTTLQLQGVQSPRCAIGARIRTTVKTPNGTRDIHNVVGTGGSFGSSSLRQEIGLGDATAIVQVEVTWPTTMAKEVFTNVPMDAAAILVEGTGTAKPWALPKLQLKGKGGAQEHQHQHASLR